MTCLIFCTSDSRSVTVSCKENQACCVPESLPETRETVITKLTDLFVFLDLYSNSLVTGCNLAFQWQGGGHTFHVFTLNRETC